MQPVKLRVHGASCLSEGVFACIVKIKEAVVILVLRIQLHHQVANWCKHAFSTLVVRDEQE